MTNVKDDQGPAAHALRKRYGNAQLHESGAWNETLALQLRHRSVRHFLPREIEEPKLELIVAAAQSASTSSNLQLCSIVAVEDQGRKDRLAKLAGDQRHVSEAPLFLVWIADLSRLTRMAEARQRSVDGADYVEGATLAIIDAALSAQNAMLAAESLGLGGVYIGGMRNHPLDVAKELHLPPRAFAVFGMCLGYEDTQRASDVKPRLPQRVVFHRETYDVEGEAEHIDIYAEYAAAFRRDQGMSGTTWIDQTLNRMRNADALGTRQNLRQDLAALGFPLK